MKTNNQILSIKDLGETILIMVPHEDDEVLMCGGVIRASIKSGKKVKVVIATNGDYGDCSFNKGKRRIYESINALSLLGLQKEDIIFLGYADTGMSYDLSFIMNLYNCNDENKIFVSSCSEETYCIPDELKEYKYSRRGVHGKYNRRAFNEDIEDVIVEVMPNTIFVTSKDDIHGDHKGLYHFVVDSVKKLIKENIILKPQIFEGLVHSPAGDLNWPEVDGKGTISYFSFNECIEEKSDLKWEKRFSFILPKEMAIANKQENLKYKAILEYKSALNDSDEVVNYLLSFVKKDEIFWKVDL